MTCRLLGGTSLSLDVTKFSNAGELREAVSENLQCPRSAVQLIRNQVLLEDELPLDDQDVSEVTVLLNASWKQLQQLQDATQAFEAVLDEIGQTRNPRARFAKPHFEAAASATAKMVPFQIDDGQGGDWTVASSNTFGAIKSLLERFRMTLQELLDSCHANLLPCWGSGSCYMECPACGPCATKWNWQAGCADRQELSDG